MVSPTEVAFVEGVVLADADIARVDAVIAAAEQRTSAEIVVALVGRSGRYRHAVLVGGILGALVVLLGFVLVRVAAEGWVARVLNGSLLDFGGLVVFGYALGAFSALRIPSLGRFCAGEAAMYEECDERASQLFVEQGVFRTGDRVGVIVCASYYERMVIVRADEAVVSRVGNAALGAFSDDLAASLRSEAIPTALSFGAMRLGALLEGPFPKTPADLNELPNRLLVLP